MLEISEEKKDMVDCKKTVSHKGEAAVKSQHNLRLYKVFITQ